MCTIHSECASRFCVNEMKSDSGRVPDAEEIPTLRDRPGVWLTFAGSAFLTLYAERLAPLALKPHWVTALAIIYEHPGVTQSSLARALRINRASSMALATTLEAGGLVTREALRGRRQTALRLTNLGRERLVEACAIEEQLVAATMDWLSPEELGFFVSVLRRVTRISSRAPVHEHT